jgi:hypothetical protein
MPILLDPTLIKTMTLGGVTTETEDAVAATEIDINLSGQTVTITFETGSPADNTFLPGAHRDENWLIINTETGVWQSSLGTSDTLSPTQLAAINLNIKNARNGAEGTANILGVMPGTFVPWT